MRPSIPLIFSILLLIISGFALFHIKFQVQNLKKDITILKKQIAQEKSQIKVLSAEWAFLNKPERLRGIIKAHFPKLSTITVAQLGFKSNAVTKRDAIIIEHVSKDDYKVNTEKVVNASLKTGSSFKGE